MTAPLGSTLPLADYGQSVRWLGRALVGRRRGRLLRAVTLMVLGQVAVLSIPSVIGRLVDHLRANEATAGLLAGQVGLIAILGVVAGVLVAAGRGLLGRLLEEVCTEMRDEALGCALVMPLTLLEATGTGDVLMRISDDSRTVGNTLRNALPTVLEAALAVAVTASVFVVLDYRLALAVVAAAPVHYWASRWYVRRSTPKYEALREVSARHAERTLSIASELTMIDRFGLSARYALLDKAHSDRVAEVHHEAVVLQTRFFGRLSLAEPVALLAVVGTGAALVDAGGLSAGQFTAAALYVLALFMPFTQILYQLDAAQSALVSLRRVVGLLRLPAEVFNPDTDGPCTWSVSLAGVEYSYPGRNRAAAGINLHAPAGTLNIIVGRSGSGKSTMAKLIGGLLQPDTGTIRVDGVPRPAPWLADKVAMVTQETMPFTGTLRWNLGMGTGITDCGRLVAAIARFGDTEWLNELPDGLDTTIGRAGQRLSIAQLQQVALARLSLHPARILVLDEPTSATDGAGTIPLDEAIRGLAGHRTVFVVAHRLSLAPVADCVVVMDGGRVIEHGTHTALLEADGSYRTLWRSWAFGVV